MLQKRYVLRFLESFAGKALEPVDLVVTVRHVSAHTDLKSLFEVGEVDVVVKTIVVQFIEDSTPHLIWFQSDPIKRRKFVLCLDLVEWKYSRLEISDPGSIKASDWNLWIYVDKTICV